MRTLNVQVQRPGRNAFVPLQVRGPDDPKDSEWDNALSRLYAKIVRKIGSGHVLCFVDSHQNIIEIEDSDDFVSAVDPTVENLILRHAQTESASQSNAATPGIPCSHACHLLVLDCYQLLGLINNYR